VIRRLLAVVAALLASTSVAHGDGLVDRYAAAVQAFDAHLTSATARLLAARVIDEADAAGIDARLVVALVATESSWKIDARSRAGAAGLGQLMPGTAADLGVDPADPLANLHGTVRYLRALLGHYAGRSVADQYVLAIAAYNAGPGAVDRYGDVPPYAETRRYVRRVVALWRRLVTG
jgi:soluble lytic murein transglycosylase-like protein